MTHGLCLLYQTLSAFCKHTSLDLTLIYSLIFLDMWGGGGGGGGGLGLGFFSGFFLDITAVQYKCGDECFIIIIIFRL